MLVRLVPDGVHTAASHIAVMVRRGFGGKRDVNVPGEGMRSPQHAGIDDEGNAHTRDYDEDSRNLLKFM